MGSQKVYSFDEAQKRYESLPQEIKELLYSVEMIDTIKKIGEKNQLHIDKIGQLESECSAVMLGFTEPTDFPAILSENLGIDQTKAGAVAQDVNEMLFTKIRDAMKKVYDQHTAEAPAVISNPPAVEKSVVMPSASADTAISIRKVETNLSSTTSSTPVVPTPSSASSASQSDVSVPLPKPTTVPEIKADVMLSETTISMPKNEAVPPQTTAPKPGPAYKTDPYREPAE